MASMRKENPLAAVGVLDTELSRMAALVESQLSGALSAFERRDIAAAERLIDSDLRVDDFDRDIEIQAMALLAQGPYDEAVLREIVTIMKLSGELERVGDLAKNIAKRTLVVAREPNPGPITGVARIGRACLRQFSDILDAYTSRDVKAAWAVWGADDEVDELYNSVFQEILLAMMDDRGSVNACTHLGFIAKNFERVGDHATNIAEAIHFVVTGEPLMERRPTGDETPTTVVTPRSAGL
ncbi:MAG: phosphate signaling complex protein PhoU [Pseudomonadota bacterium]